MIEYEIILSRFNTYVLGVPDYFYPNKYNITIKNVNKNEIKSIELIYDSGCGFNYESNNDFRYWLRDTEFGYKYKNYTDEEIIPTLTSKEIDAIAMSYIHEDTSNISGYWIDESVIKTKTSITKFAIYENINIKYNNNEIVVTYSADKEHYSNINDMYLRIVKTDNTILYSNSITSNMVGLVDEYSTSKEFKEAESITHKTAYFEVDFFEIENHFDVIENLEYNNFLFNYNVIFLILIIFVIILLFVKYNKKKKISK